MPDLPVTGHTSAGFEPVRDAFAANFRDDGELGAGFAVMLDGEVIVDLLGGWADRQKTREWDARTLVPVYSTTKGISALVLAALVADLQAGYETRVAEIWPEFAANGKDAVTIGELASHQAGLPGFMDEIDPDLWLDPPACAAAIAALAPLWPPGSAHGYHPLTWGYLVGELARRISGMTLGTWLRDKVCAPKGIDFYIGLPAGEHARCADIRRPSALPELGDMTEPKRAAFGTKWSSPNRGGAIWREIEIPSANGHGTAASIAALYDAYAHGGTLAGMPLMPVQAFDALTRARVDGPDLVLNMSTSFGAGIMRNSHGLFGPNAETVGHCGWGGSMAIADRDRRLTCAYVMNRQSNVLVGDPRAVRLVNAVYGCL
ncbi:serine hydrolase domain-containing protein [Hyphomonas sp.]|uniref:serine hydrolase domain-containing protein n=1 Tax=Hyphomonas sp. TaxID=87 RepID=UPI0032F05CD5